VESPFPPGSFDKQDTSADGYFYAQPRLVTHIDDAAIAAVGEAYQRFLPPDGVYLDLMSSWVSHFPADRAIRRLVGHGMNDIEMRNNPRLNEYFLQDLNLNPALPLDDASFDGVVICVSVQYLTRPVEVFAEAGRVLKPGAPLIVAYSNRCFPTKAVRIWQALDDAGHGRLIAAYAAATGLFEPAEIHDFSPRLTFHGIPDDADLRRRIALGEVYTDPLFVVVARKTAAATV
jgi:SAM-dependent methyltransferase